MNRIDRGGATGGLSLAAGCRLTAPALVGAAGLLAALSRRRVVCSLRVPLAAPRAASSI